MPRIFMIVHPLHDPFMPTEWEAWDLRINGLEKVQFMKLSKISSEIHEVKDSTETHKRRGISASYIIEGGGPGRFPLITAILPFLEEIQRWGYLLMHCSCPTPDEFSMCILQK